MATLSIIRRWYLRADVVEPGYPNRVPDADVKISRGHLVLTLPGKADPDRVKALMHRWYLDHARRVFMDVLDEFLPSFRIGSGVRL
ncbi:MAG: hypothetical protein ACYDCF_09570 [Burkholderiales bacterium]